MTDYTATWYHGSPHKLTVLSKGNMITQFREVAKAFAHKPSIMSMSDDRQAVKHNGRLPGLLYAIAEPIGPNDVSLLSGTADTHWQTQRGLRVEPVAELAISDPPLLTDEELSALKKQHPDAGTASFFRSVTASKQ